MEKVSVGIIGLGAIGKKAHLPVLSGLRDVRMKAICDSNSDRLARRAKERNIPETYEDYQEMFEDADLDAVFVCVPTFLHYKVVLAALKAGVNVFCEKPMGRSSREARELVDLARKKSLVLAVGYNKRLNENYVQARKTLEELKLGNILQAHAISVTPGPYVDWIASSDWFFDEKTGGILYDIFPHLLDLLMFILSDDIIGMDAKASASRSELGMVDNISTVYRTENGVIGTISVGWGAGASNESIQVHGTGGSFLAGPFGFRELHGKINPLTVTSGPLSFLRMLAQTRAANMNPLDGVDETYFKEDRAFIDSIVGDGKPYATGAEALKVLEIIDSLESSLKEDRSV